MCNNYQFYSFCLTWTGFEPMAYHTQARHANYYTTDEGELKLFSSVNQLYLVIKSLNQLQMYCYFNSPVKSMEVNIFIMAKKFQLYSKIYTTWNLSFSEMNSTSYWGTGSTLNSVSCWGMVQHNFNIWKK